jgi:hypothetical protein
VTAPPDVLLWLPSGFPRKAFSPADLLRGAEFPLHPLWTRWFQNKTWSLFSRVVAVDSAWADGLFGLKSVAFLGRPTLLVALARPMKGSGMALRGNWPEAPREAFSPSIGPRGYLSPTAAAHAGWSGTA